ncbi:MAG: iron-sulfur cluster assembly scaffold protein [Methanosarcinales archaeon]|nr:MAG: iron-sulfur cluster assembly scaffold protein [Methanosarcinales archaeon]
MTDVSTKSDFDKTIEKLQRNVNEQERMIFSKKVIKEYNNPKNIGKMAQPDAFAILTGWCGDTMEIYLKMEHETVANITFMTDGCGSTIACGSMLTSMVKGKSLDEAEAITEDDLIAALEGLPEENLHCAHLAIITLRDALKMLK